MNPQRKHQVSFDLQKSQMLRGFAVLCIIVMHHTNWFSLQICVPIFTFLIGYGYALSAKKGLLHSVARSWRLLSNYWIIYFVLFYPCAIWFGHFVPSWESVLPEMIGINRITIGYTWYIYFYLYAIFIMLPASRILNRFGLYGFVMLTLVALLTCTVVHFIPGWKDNNWWEALWLCSLYTPVLYSGYLCASKRLFSKVRIRHNLITLTTLIAIAVACCHLRQIRYGVCLDFVTTAVFIFAFSGIIDILHCNRLDRAMTCIGRESMNMWLVSSLFVAGSTWSLFHPLLCWIDILWVGLAVKIIVCFSLARVFTRLYQIVMPSMLLVR